MVHIKTTPSLGFSEAVNKATSKIFQFKGRSRRSEYWWTYVAVYLISIVLTPITGYIVSLLLIPLTFRRLHDIGKSGWWWGGCAILQIITFGLFIYDIIYISIYDLHGDELYLSLLIKYSIFLIIISIWKIILLVFYCMDSEPHANKYGESPKHIFSEDIQE